MNYILHGEDNRLSRQRLNEIIGPFDPAVVSRRSPSSSTFFDNQLFARQELVIFEFFKKEELKDFPAESFFEDLESSGPEIEVVFWFNFELSSSNKFLKQAQRKGFTELNFKVPQAVFKVVDAFFAPKKLRGRFYSLLADIALNSVDHLFLLQMLIRNLRLLIWASLNNRSFLNLVGFVRKKSEAGKAIRPEKLVTLYGRLVDLEKRFKTGSPDLTSEILLAYEEF